MHNTQLEHAGVKGMKWGVRKEEYNSASRADRKTIRKVNSIRKSAERGNKHISKHGGFENAAHAATGKELLGYLPSAALLVAASTLGRSNPNVSMGLSAVSFLGSVVNAGVSGQRRRDLQTAELNKHNFD